MSKQPKAILISDIHYRLDTLELADASLRQAVKKARDFYPKYAIPDVYVCGDTNDTKAIIRGEVANRLINTCRWASQEMGVSLTFIVGNHDRLNEKSPEHSLEFLKSHAHVVDKLNPEFRCMGGVIPYCSTVEEFKAALSRCHKNFPVLIHQGVKGANAGHYIQDHSAVDVQILKDYRTFGGHYHNHHTVGTHTFIGNPYTLNFGEANDHPKGFLVLNEDGTYEHVPTNLRKHIKVEYTGRARGPCPNYTPGDLVWVKVNGCSLELDTLKKAEVAEQLGIPESFKLDLVPTDSKVIHIDQKCNKTHPELMDLLVDSSAESAENKAEIKDLYRELMK